MPICHYTRPAQCRLQRINAYDPISRFVPFWLVWIHGGGTFHAGITPPGRIIHGATYFEDAGQRTPVRDVASRHHRVLRNDSGLLAARSSHGARPETVARHRALCPSVRPGTAPCLRTNETDKLLTNYIPMRIATPSP